MPFGYGRWGVGPAEMPSGRAPDFAETLMSSGVRPTSLSSEFVRSLRSSPCKADRRRLFFLGVQRGKTLPPSRPVRVSTPFSSEKPPFLLRDVEVFGRRLAVLPSAVVTARSRTWGMPLRRRCFLRWDFRSFAWRDSPLKTAFFRGSARRRRSRSFRALRPGPLGASFSPSRERWFCLGETGPPGLESRRGFIFFWTKRFFSLTLVSSETKQRC